MNTAWSFDDPKVLDAIRARAETVEAAPFTGDWAAIEFQPDAFSPQTYSIGVIVAQEGGPIAFKLISDTSKLQCVYGRKLGSRFDEFLRSAEYTLSRALKEQAPIGEIHFDTDNLRISTPWPTSGLDQAAVLGRLFNDVVALEPGDESVAPDFLSLDNHQVRQLVGNELKRIAGLAYERIVVDPKQTVIVDREDNPHRLDFNLRTERGAGSVVSAIYKTPVTVELNLLRADRDLRTYAGIRGISDLAVFVMVPKREQMEAPDFNRLSDLIDETSWRLERGGLRLTAFDEPRPIAESILEWAGIERV